MDDSIERPGSPLYEAIREILSGQWEEDEYDVAEPPLSYVDYKSQVLLDVVDQVPVPIADAGASDTDFESLKSDESEWSKAEGADDTMATDIDIDIDIDIEVRERPNTEYTDLLSGIDDGAFGESYGGTEDNEKGRVESWASGATGTSESGTIASTEAVVGERVKGGIGSGFEKVTGDDTDEESGTEVTEEEDDSASESGTENESNTETLTVTNREPKALDDIEIARRFREAMGPITPDPPAGKPIVPINELIEPPPIPSRSPSRPGTSMANRKAQADIQEIFTTAQAGGSAISLAPVRMTVSSLSSPRSSRFFEELSDPTTATSVDNSEKLTLSPPSPSRKRSADSAEKEPSKPKDKRQKIGFFRSCGLKLRLWKKKPGEPKGSSAKEYRRSASISSLIKKW